MDVSAKQQQYFPNLDGLRFVGALVLIILHIEGIKSIHHVATFYPVYHYFNEGDHFVSLFFVLSGFLITYLLLAEKERVNKIDLKRFYTRRILKIWPLYFLVGIAGYFILPYFGGDYAFLASINLRGFFWYSALLYLFFLPPVISSRAIGATWSVRVEELFYLFWPLLLSVFKKPMVLFISVIIFVIALRNGLRFAAGEWPGDITQFLFRQAKSYRVSCMAFGGLAAYVYIKNYDKLLSVLCRKSVQWLVYGVSLVFLLLKIIVPHINYEVYALLFSVIVLNLAVNPKSIIKLDYNWMSYLGKVSYGLYLYNPIVRNACFIITVKVFGSQFTGLLPNVLLYSLTIAGTIFISVISFEFFEKRFLNLKKRFT